MIHFYRAILFSLLSITAMAQNKTIVYKESQEDMVNPERGFYIPIGTKASHFVLLNAAQLKLYRYTPQHPSKASYSVNVSLLYRSYELDTFKNKPLSASFLTNLQKDFDAVREAGLKIILRFAYTNTAKTGDCPDQYKICPPYGDAPRNVVLNHIAQLTPLLRNNADVIAVLQEGFIGIWGENYFTDYFGDASTNSTGKVADSSWLQRNGLLKALLDALPKSRMVQVRTPQIKQKSVYGPGATVNSLPLTLTDAYKKSDKARIGFHNDCFLSSPDDYGTYYDYGSSSQPRKPATEILRKYIEADTKFTVVGGETCDDSFSPQNDCAPAGHAEEEMQQMHYSYLNAAYNNDVNNDWDSSGCLPGIKRKLGYRFVLRKSVLPYQLTKTGSMAIEFTVENIGYASPYNPRPVKIILRNTATHKEYAVTLKANPQYWFTGIHQIKETINLPAGMVTGSYQLFIYLPDEAVLLSNRPEYSIRLANEDLWEEMTGYNNLQHSIKLK
jgi:hypothetical protein